MASAWIRHCDARYIGAYADTLVNINNSVNDCNFILGLQVALKTFVSVVPFLLIFFDGAIGGGARPPAPHLHMPLLVYHYKLTLHLLLLVMMKLFTCSSEMS